MNSLSLLVLAKLISKSEATMNRLLCEAYSPSEDGQCEDGIYGRCKHDGATCYLAQHRLTKEAIQQSANARRNIRERCALQILSRRSASR